jgi:prolipoprotein diacylglyceryltransferase
MRFIVEFWRANPIVGLGMTEYQWISLVLVILGAGMLYYQWNRADQTGHQDGINVRI